MHENPQTPNKVKRKINFFELVNSFLGPPKGYRREFGFQLPLDKLQMLQYVGEFLLLLEIVLITLPMLPIYLLIPCGIIMIFLFVFDVCSILFIEFFNPADPLLKSSEKQAEASKALNTKWCIYCQKFVDKTSKHCKLCDKCILNFDHHCRWLNTCVGDTNYKSFFTFLSSIFLILLFAIVLKIISAALLPFRWGTYTSSLYNLYWYIIPWWVHLSIATFSLFCEFLVFIPITQLFFFHIRLKFLGLTTYQYIMNQRRVKAKEEKEYVEKMEIKLRWCFKKRKRSIDITREKFSSKKLAIFKINKIVPKAVVKEVLGYSLKEKKNQKNITEKMKEKESEGDVVKKNVEVEMKTKREVEMKTIEVQEAVKSNETTEVFKYKSDVKVGLQSSNQERKKNQESNRFEIIEIEEKKKAKKPVMKTTRKMEKMKKLYKIKSLSNLSKNFSNIRRSKSPELTTHTMISKLFFSRKSRSQMHLRDYIDATERERNFSHRDENVEKINIERKSLDPIDLGDSGFSCFTNGYDLGNHLSSFGKNDISSESSNQGTESDFV